MGYLVQEKLIILPKFSEIIVILVGITIFIILKYNIFNGDSLLAWPITEKIIYPDLYNDKDLIIKSGIESSFNFYKIISLLPFLRDNFPLRDFIIYLVTLVLLLLGWYNVFFALVKNRIIVLLSIPFFLFSDGKLGLNWSNSPMPMLVSSTSVHFAQVFSFLLFLKRRYYLSIFIMAVTGYFHPATSITYSIILLMIIFLQNYKKNHYIIIKSCFLFLLVFLPNFIFLRSNIDINIDFQRYFEIFKLFQYHAYLEDHYRMGYSYAIALIFLLYKASNSGFIDVNEKRTIQYFFLFGILGSIIWLLNLYFIRNLHFIYFYFITRFFYIAKPLLIILFVYFIFNSFITSKNFYVKYFIHFLLLSTLVIFSPTVSLIILCCYLISHVFKKGRVIFCSTLFLLFVLFLFYNDNNNILTILKEVPDNSLVIFEIIILVFIVLPLTNKLVLSENKKPIETKDLKRFLVFSAAVLCLFFITSNRLRNNIVDIIDRKKLNFSTTELWGVKHSNVGYYQLVMWARNQKGKLFIVPPYDYDFLSFRYLTKNGVYIHEGDINQLMYSPKYYLIGYERLLNLGMKVKARHIFDWSRYNNLTLNEIKALDADFIIFKKRDLKTKIPNGIVFENDEYIVYKIQKNEENI